MRPELLLSPPTFLVPNTDAGYDTHFQGEGNSASIFKIQNGILHGRPQPPSITSGDPPVVTTNVGSFVLTQTEPQLPIFVNHV